MIPKIYTVTYTGKVNVVVSAFSKEQAIELAKQEVEDASYYKDNLVVSVKDLTDGIAEEV